MSPDLAESKRVRRLMAQASMVLTWVIVIAFMFGLTSNDIAARVEKVWPPFAVLFPSLMAYVGWYAKLGSDEIKQSQQREMQ